ncbi:MAG: helix-turn-helix domain-containing protein [Lentisphaeria bacterium]|nr:helix-turn-helix domain-containing protein [Lentisphaeria bacterium]
MHLETTYVLNEPEIPLQIHLHMAGITHPNPHYRMDRWANPCSYYIFEMVTNGHGVLETIDTTYYLEAGDAYLIPQGTKCSYHSDKKDPYEKIWFNVSGELITALCSLYNLNTITVFRQIKLEEEFAQALKEVARNHKNAYCSLAVALHSIINKFHIFQNQKVLNNNYSRDAILLKDYLDMTWMRKLSQQKLCQLINKSPAQMQRIFKAAWGVSPGQYVQEIRLKTSIQYLSNTNFTIRRIAERVGFSNEYYFANWFKEKTGFAPKSYPPQPRKADAEENR